MVDSRDPKVFEVLLRQFDDAVTALETDSLSLDEALEQYESAVQLAKECARVLHSAEVRITEIDETLNDLDVRTEE